MINIYREPHGDFEVWSNPEDEPDKYHAMLGRCIGVSNTKLGALLNARRELNSDIIQLNEEITKLTSK